MKRHTLITNRNKNSFLNRNKDPPLPTPRKKKSTKFQSGWNIAQVCTEKTVALPVTVNRMLCGCVKYGVGDDYGKATFRGSGVGWN